MTSLVRITVPNVMHGVVATTGLAQLALPARQGVLALPTRLGRTAPLGRRFLAPCLVSRT